jgi:hypothetical protein
MRVGRIVFGALLSAIVVAPTQAATQRTFVSTQGIDNPTCSLVAPCRTFTAAITATIAGGEVIVIDSGGYGSVTITQSVSINAPTGIYAGISVSSGDGVLVNGTGIGVVLRGLSINNVGTGASGIVISDAARVTIERCAISGFTSGLQSSGRTEINVTDSLFLANLTGVELLSSGSVSRVTLSRVRITHAQGAGVHAAPGHLLLSLIDTTIAESNNAVWLESSANTMRFDIRRGEFISNSVAVLAMASGGAGSNVIGVISDTLVADSSSAGISADADGVGAIAVLDVTNCVIRHNGNGLRAQNPGATITFRNNLIVDNAFGILAAGGALVTGLGNTMHGNGTPGAPTGTLAPL